MIGYYALAAVVLWWLISLVNPDPRKVLKDHVMYLHGTLGTGKTAIAAHWAARVMRPYSRFDALLFRLLRRRPPVGRTVYASFELAGAKPLDLRVGQWPSERGACIIIDEVLLLESNGLLPIEWFSKGCTLARQLGQQVLILSQASRIEGKFRKFQGTFGLWLKVGGWSFRPFGRLVWVRYSSEPFRRSSKGFKSHGSRSAFIWVPQSAFRSYNSTKIYGYTCDTDGSWLELDMARNGGVAGQAGPTGQSGPTQSASTAVGGAAALRSPRGPSWHRPGGKTAKTRVRRS